MAVGLLIKCGLFNSRIASLLATQSRSVAQIPPWEYHIRFSPIDGRKRPCQDALDRFKRLNNGMWIRVNIARNKKRYQKPDWWQEMAMQHYACSPSETQMLTRMVNNFWLRPKYYADDMYDAYNVRHGLKTPRVDYSGRLVRERKKILLEDAVADQHFYDR